MVCAWGRAVQLGLGEGETEAHNLCKASPTPTTASPQVFLGETEECSGKASGEVKPRHNAMPPTPNYCKRVP